MTTLLLAPSQDIELPKVSPKNLLEWAKWQQVAWQKSVKYWTDAIKSLDLQLSTTADATQKEFLEYQKVMFQANAALAEEWEAEEAAKVQALAMKN
jgi:hypothetical protein